jgi:hypothetical protein
LRQNEGTELEEEIKGGKRIESIIKGKELVGGCRETDCEVDDSN